MLNTARYNTLAIRLAEASAGTLPLKLAPDCHRDARLAMVEQANFSESPSDSTSKLWIAGYITGDRLIEIRPPRKRGIHSTAKIEQAIEFIIRNPHRKQRAVAIAIHVSYAHFRKDYVPELRLRGVSTDSGMYLPKTP